MFTKMTLLCTTACLIIIVLGCSNSSSPAIVNVDVTLQNREMTPTEISVTKDDTLIMNITSDENGALHVHGYDFKQIVDAEESVTLQFDAIATGAFKIAFHVEQSDHSHDEHSKEEHSEAKHSEDEKETIVGLLIVNPR